MSGPIPIKIKLTVSPSLQDQKIRINYQNKLETRHIDTKEKEFDINIMLDLSAKRVKIFEVSGIIPDPICHMMLTKMSINGYEVEYFRELLSFQMNGNPYVENELLTNLNYIGFNGSLNLEIKPNLKRLSWFATTFSSNKKHITYLNGILGCSGEYGCWEGQECIHDDPWQVLDKSHLSIYDHHDIVALGDSFTAGTGIKKKMAWPSLLRSKNTKVLNLGVPGSGIDSIMLNAINLVKSGKHFGRLVILLPYMARKLVRIHRHGNFFDFFIQNSFRNALNTFNHFNIYIDRSEVQEIIERHTKRLVMEDWEKRNIRIMKRMLAFLRSNKINFKISSWADDTYDILRDLTNENEILPKFNEENDQSKGIDNSHPSESVHKKWIESVMPSLDL